MTTSRRAALRELLIQRRRQLQPADLGLPDTRTPGRGISQEAVAELAGISLNWYELFESGRNDRRVSSQVVERIARVLRFGPEDTAELLRLALPESEAIARLARSREDGALSHLRAVGNLARRLMAATTFEDIATQVAEMMQSVIGPDAATVGTLVHASGGSSGIAVGPNAELACDATYEVHWEALQNIPPRRVAYVEGSTPFDKLLNEEVDLAISTVGEEPNPPSHYRFTPDTYRRALSRMRVVSSLNLPLAGTKRVHGLVGMFWTEPRHFSSTELEMAKTVAALVSVATSRG